MGCFQPCYLTSIAPPTGLPEAHIILVLLRGISCSLFAVVKLITDHLREISTMEMYTVPVYAQEVDLSPSHQ